MTFTAEAARLADIREIDLASGKIALVRTDGSVEGIYFLEELYGVDEGPTCSICDGLGHGYPGGPPCPIEDRGGYDPDYDRF